MRQKSSVLQGKSSLSSQCTTMTENTQEFNTFNGNSSHNKKTIMAEDGTANPVNVTIYVAQHCSVCEYSYEVADVIRRDFPQVELRIVDLGETSEEVPEIVFATPTYLLNGRVWSLGNPSSQQVNETLSRLVEGVPH